MNGSSNARFESRSLSRRGFLQNVASGVQGAALLSLLARDGWADQPETHQHVNRPGNLISRKPDRDPPARNVIHLFMNGGPSQMDLFDPKPELDRRHGTAYFEEIAGEVENPQVAGALFRSPFKFAQHGESGGWVSEVLPHMAQCIDEIAVIKSMYTTNLTHEPALFKIHSGQERPGLPSIGAWVTYGLGTDNQNLPAYVVLDDPQGLPVNNTQSWQSGYLPAVFQGTRFRSTGSPVLDLQPDYREPALVADRKRKFLYQLDQWQRELYPEHDRLAARIASYELAARMQLAATDALDLSQETQQTLDAYGVGNDATDSYGRRCLYARRLVERGVRYVQLFIEFQIWDNHTSIEGGLRKACRKTDQPIAALIRDLKQRGLLDQTLVVWGGEFGRLPIAQLKPGGNESTVGRDHNKNAMVTWMAGGGVKGGTSYGATDELGFSSVENRVSVPDFHATILHQLGLQYEQLTFLRNGLEERLTGVDPARVVQEILS